jgi:hypothetical protein
MLHFPSPGLLSVYRANFDACADKIPTFLLFQQQNKFFLSQVPPPPPPLPDIALQHGCRDVHETLHQPTPIHPFHKWLPIKNYFMCI